LFKISIENLSDIDINELAKFSYNARYMSVFQNVNRTVAGIEQSLTEAAENDYERIILARDRESHEIIGKLACYIGFPEMVFIHRWDPVMAPLNNRDSVAGLLINQCKKYIKKLGFKRLEVTLSPILDGFEEVREDYQTLYEREGFHQATKEASMRIEMSKWNPSLEIPTLPEGYSFESVNSRTNEEIEETVLRTFEASGDRLHLDMSPTQQRITFNHWFDRTRPFHSTSIYLVRDNQVVGFSIGRAYSGVVSLGPIGLLPDYRGRGLAQILLHESLIKIKNDRAIKYAELEVDITNTPAIKLYTSVGFSPQHMQEYYSWTVSK